MYETKKFKAIWKKLMPAHCHHAPRSTLRAAQPGFETGNGEGSATRPNERWQIEPVTGDASPDGFHAISFAPCAAHRELPAGV
jgi:hypothetical protein